MVYRCHNRKGINSVSFDASQLNASCLALGDDTVLNTSTGPRPITVIISVFQDIDSSGGFDVLTDRVTAETVATELSGIRRGDTIVTGGKTYTILAWQTDATGWVVMEVEEA